MDSHTRPRSQSQRAAIAATLFASASAALVVFALWAAPVVPGRDLNALDRASAQVGLMLRARWYACLCPSIAVTAAAWALLLFGLRVPAGCAYAAATVAALAFVAALALSVLVGFNG